MPGLRRLDLAAAKSLKRPPLSRVQLRKHLVCGLNRRLWNRVRNTKIMGPESMKTRGPNDPKDHQKSTIAASLRGPAPIDASRQYPDVG